MREYVVKGNKKMRQGVTTGACATGAAKAAASMLLTHTKVEAVDFEARNGKVIRLEIDECEVTDNWVRSEERV